MAEPLEGRTAADVMLSRPKTVAPSASVAEVRELLAKPSVLMVLIADGDRFCGAVTELPNDADGDAPALDVVVLEDDRLVGLVCLDETRTRFCGRPSRNG